MPTIISEQPKKVPNLKPFHRPEVVAIKSADYTNINFPFQRQYGPKTFGAMAKSMAPVSQEFKLPAPGEGLPRVVHYCADQSGCAFWRLLWPAEELLAHNKAVVMTLYQMVTIGQFYGGIDAVRLQRQCTAPQLEFIKFLRKVSDELKKQTGKGFKIIYEVDDLVLKDLLPDYNVCGTAFQDPNIEKVVKEAVHLCDEFTVPSEHMAEIYRKRLDYDKITVIPNYAPKNWIDRGYDRAKVVETFNNNKNKPRVLYAGSGTHFDVANKANQQDDFGGVVDAIAKDILIDKKYEWVFLGAIPLKLRQFIGNGIEFHEWCAITDYPEMIKKLKVNASIAPLQDNHFNHSKANIKLTEAGMQGIPCVAQNLDCYNFDGWKYLFNNSDELMKILAEITSSEEKYMEASDFAKSYADGYILQNHLDELVLLYTTSYGDSKRKDNPHFIRNNPKQFIE